MPLSNAKVLATFMEPKPTRRYREFNWDHEEAPRWWTVSNSGQWAPAYDTWTERVQLGSHHEVEARLTDEQWAQYMVALLPDEFTPPFPLTAFQAVTHASAEQKLTALAAVLRPIVEGKNAE